MSSYLSKRRIRYSFGKISSNVSIPNLIKVQKRSYEEFLQLNVSQDNRKKQGLEEVLQSVFQLSDVEGKAKLEYIHYNLGDPKYTPEECIQRGVNYASPLRVSLRLILWDCDLESESKEIKGIKEQEVYMGDIPLMTDKGTFIINGAQRVVVSQLHRSPGVFYSHDEGKNSSSRKFIYSARIIPYRGSWIDFEFDTKDILYFRIDRKRKIHISTLLRAIGYDTKQIIQEFYRSIHYKLSGDKLIAIFVPSKFARGAKIEHDILDADTGDVILKKGVRITPRLLKDYEENNIKRHYIAQEDEIKGSFLAKDIISPTTGEVLYESTQEITQEVIDGIRSLGDGELTIIDINNNDSGTFLRDTIVLDKNKDENQALADIYKVLRPGEPSTPEVAKQLFESMFFDEEKYDLSAVGRMKINKKHNLDTPGDYTALTKNDVIVVIKHLLQLKCGNGSVDDIDSLANRRVRSVGELVENQFRMGLVKMQRSILDRMSSVEIDSVMPHDLVNSKTLMSYLREFFGISQLSQFMDQTNPLSEITHKRRLSALGPGGLTRERAGFEVRDVHATHYSRICPIETPEGQNIGLISSLATYADINQYGFIESPYRKIKNGYVTEEIIQLTAIEEEKYYIAKSSIRLNDDGMILDDLVACHKKGEVVNIAKHEVDLIDVSPQQLVSVAASLIPFLENDDANRALMGSNMQRQAVPLITNEAPFIGTGMEKVVACDSGTVLLAKRSGIVDQLDSKRIVIKVKESEESEASEVSGVDIYTLVKHYKSNQGTCINQRPIVKVGEFVKKGDIMADGASTDMGELALGKNILVAFMPWNGYNFEDSILLSERLVKEDVYTSVHINEYEVIARDTRLGSEEITRDIPNLNEENLSHLDETGIVNIGAEVTPGDILVGKVTPKTESPLTPEEKLLRAIFGEKAADVRNSSLRVPPGEKGVVVDIKIFTKRGVQKDERAISIERSEIEKFSKDRDDEVRIIGDYVFSKIKDILFGQKVKVKAGRLVLVDSKFMSNISSNDLLSLEIDDVNIDNEVRKLEKFYNNYLKRLEKEYKHKVEKLQSGDDLPQGVLKIVKVYVANKLKIQPGDKMAGRHGNKGVVSKIVPIEEMPFLSDGQPVDIVLNPLGVPSRMNIGQILETHLGWASVALGKKVSAILEKSLRSYNESNELELRSKIKEIYEIQEKNDKKVKSYVDELKRDDLLDLAKDVSKGVKFATPVFDGAKEEQINNMLRKSGLDTSGQVRLRDGRTGEYFDRKVTVGYIYMLKLDHLVDNKIHARSIGPYSLVTQQPLGGKSHFGGQRLGEMECWALQAYGAAYTLQEILTVKSDDVSGRIKAYEAIIRGENSFEVGLPESFKVMIKEIRSLGLNMEIIEKE